MSIIRLLNNGEWNKLPVLTAARKILMEGLAEHGASTALGDLATFTNGTSYDPGMVVPDGTPIIRISNITNPRSDYLKTQESFDGKFMVETGDLLVSWSASFKTIIWPGPHGVLNQHIFTVREKQGNDRGFIRHAIEAAFDDMQQKVVGIGMMHLRRGDFLGHEVPVPDFDTQRAVCRFLDWLESPNGNPEPPLPAHLKVQRRVVARIEALAAKIAEARGLRRQAMEEVNTFSFAAAREAFTEVSSGSPPRPIKGAFRFRTDLIRPADGITGTLRFVGLQHVESDTGKRLGEDIISAETLDGRKFQFAPGEIVYGYLRPYLNKVWVADREGICSVDQYVLRPIDSEIDTHYLAHFMRSPSFVEQAKILTNNLMLPRLRSGLLESVEMPRPPLSEQRRIVAYLDSVQAKVGAVRRLQTETAAELDALLPAVLHRAFRGEL